LAQKNYLIVGIIDAVMDGQITANRIIKAVRIFWTAVRERGYSAAAVARSSVVPTQCTNR